MPTLVHPLHTAPICGVSVRFFAAPSGRTEVPWHSVEDLYAALRLPHAARRDMLQGARRVIPTEVAATPDGTVIQSHQALLGVVGAMAEAGLLPLKFERDYAAAGEAVLAAMHEGLTEDERTDALVAMAENTLGVKLVVQPRQASVATP